MIEIIDEYFTEVYSDGNYNQQFYQEIEQSYQTLLKVDCRRLLIIGKVQSGKTSHFIGLTCKLFDNNYQLGIVLFLDPSNVLTLFHKHPLHHIRAWCQNEPYFSFLFHPLS